MKKINPTFAILLTLTIGLSSLLAGCDGDDKADCKSDPKAKGCPLYEGNITDSSNKSWSLDKEDKKPTKEDK